VPPGQGLSPAEIQAYLDTYNQNYDYYGTGVFLRVVEVELGGGFSTFTFYARLVSNIAALPFDINNVVQYRVWEGYGTPVTCYVNVPILSGQTTSPLVALPAITSRTGPSSGLGNGYTDYNYNTTSYIAQKSGERLYYYNITNGGPFYDFGVQGGISSVTATSAGTGGGGYTYYINEVTGSTGYIYYMTSSNQLVLNSTIAQYYDTNGLIYNNSWERANGYSDVEKCVLKLYPEVGDRFSFYNTKTNRTGWNESYEFVVSAVTYLTSSTASPTGSRLLISIDRNMNLDLMIPVTKDQRTNANSGSANYILWKHVPDETNLILYYNPSSSVAQDGLVYPQYLDKATKDNSGNVVKSLKSDNLI
jgi:hypothetical protein